MHKFCHTSQPPQSEPTAGKSPETHNCALNLKGVLVLISWESSLTQSGMHYDSPMWSLETKRNCFLCFLKMKPVPTVTRGGTTQLKNTGKPTKSDRYNHAKMHVYCLCLLG